MFEFAELDQTTRRYMLAELESEVAAGTLYLSNRLTPEGKAAYPSLLRTAIRSGNDTSLTQALRQPAFWNTHEVRVRQGTSFTAKMPNNAPEILAEGEFNVFYMRGFCRRLLAEGEAQVEVYRAKAVSQPRAGERINPGDRLACQDVLDDLQSREEGASKLGIPRGPASGLSLRRIHK